jgi:hypothetical protein
MMRSWENRADCCVVDEPFYAAYLFETGLEHPCREEILSSQSSDYHQVIDAMTNEEVATPLQYLKQMTHHLPPGLEMGWCAGLRHCFLIRDPAHVVASYIKKMPSVNEDDIGIRRQAELFRQITSITGITPAVIDCSDVLKNPEKILGELCDYLEIDFSREQMLHWPAGRRASDGVWAHHWYHDVEQSTGFGEYREQSPELNQEQWALAEAMRPFYDELAKLRIHP